jgi:hypothetical protein
VIPLVILLLQAARRELSGFDGDERKHKFNSLNAGSYDVTAEELEAYKMSKGRSDDPMAKFQDDSDVDGSAGSTDSSDSDSGRDNGKSKRRNSSNGKASKKKAKESKRQSSKRRKQASSGSD